MKKKDFGNKTDFIGPYNYYIYNSNYAIIISSNKVSKARNHFIFLNKTVKIHNV